MKKALCVLLLLALAMPAALAAGDFSRIAGTYELSSGVGAWFTELVVAADGSFTGHYQDTDMDGGDLGGASYQSTVYQCDFTGRLSAPEFVGDYEVDCSIQSLEREELPSWVADGVLNVFTAPSGLNAHDRLRFFLEGADVADLPEGFLVWVRMREGGVRWESLPYNGLYDETADTGFSGSGGDASGIIWLPGAEDTAPTGSGEWAFVDGDGEAAPAPQATAVPSALPQGTADDGGDAAEGIAYPVQAEVVNCQTGVSLRAQPSTKADLLAEVPLGATVSVHSNKAWLGNDRWFVEASYNGQQGYICVEYLDVLLPENLSYSRGYLKGLDGIVSAANPGSDLILRSGPGKDYDSLGLLFGGEVLGYKGEAKKDAGGTCWYRCSHYGEDCWISAKYTVLTTNDGKSYTGSRGVY